MNRRTVQGAAEQHVLGLCPMEVAQLRNNTSDHVCTANAEIATVLFLDLPLAAILKLCDHWRGKIRQSPVLIRLLHGLRPVAHHGTQPTDTSRDPVCALPADFFV